MQQLKKIKQKMLNEKIKQTTVKDLSCRKCVFGVDFRTKQESVTLLNKKNKYNKSNNKCNMLNVQYL